MRYVALGAVIGLAAVPPGRYRVRFAGEGYRLARGADGLRIELWPRRADAPPSVRRRWAGWTPGRRHPRRARRMTRGRRPSPRG